MFLKKIACGLLCAAMLLAAGCGGVGTQTGGDKAYLQLTDAAGRQVSLAKKPERVVSLSPSYLSMIEAVGGTVVGRASSKVGKIPESMKSVPEVGMVYNINMEALVGLKPDLVLASKNQHDKFIPMLQSNKINVVEFDTQTFEDVKGTIKTLGDIYGTQDKAKKENELLDKQVAAVTSKLPKEKKRIVIMHATASAVTVEGSHSIAGCVSDILGFENVAAAALKGKSNKTPYSMETLVEQNPEIIFITSMGKPEEIENRLRTDFKNNPAWNSLPAVKAGRVYVLPEKLFLINPGLRYPEAVSLWHSRFIRRSLLMENKQSVEQTEHFGIGRTKWRITILVIFLFLAVLGSFLSLTKGSSIISIKEITDILLNPGNDPRSQIIWNIRMPRTIVGALVGINLSLSGAILQAIMRNPLADPHIIGISSGAGLAGVVIMILFPAMEYLITPVAFIGAMLAAVCIYILAWKNGIKRCVLFLPVLRYLPFWVQVSAADDFLQRQSAWRFNVMVGGLAARSWPHVNIILPYAVIGLILALASAAYLNILQLGDEMARGLGVNVEVTRIILTAIAALLAASAVSVVGLLGFVGLVVPHAARLLIGSDYRFLLPASALLGIAIVTLSDTFARVIFAPIELPVGIIMAFLGAPFFLFLLRREI